MSLTMATVIACPRPLTDNSATALQRTAPQVNSNRHIPVCSPGPRPAGRRLASSPPTSPASPAPLVDVSSLLHPSAPYPTLSSDPPVHALTAKQLHAALDHAASQPLPAPHQVFPWLHGLHPDNNIQLGFFINGGKGHRRTPRCIRSTTLVKAGSDLTTAKIRGAIAADELLCAAKVSQEPQFIDIDPRDGFSVRNFQIQAAKMATVSDIVVYGDDHTPKHQVLRLAERLSKAQRAWRARDIDAGVDRPTFSTYVVTDDFSNIEKNHSQIVSIDSKGHLTGNVLDFFHAERAEMRIMSAASEIAKNVWLGPTPEAIAAEHFPEDDDSVIPYEFLIECNEMAPLPNRSAFTMLEKLATSDLHKDSVPQLEFPGSGSIMPPTWSQLEADGLLATIEWVYQQANGIASTAGTAEVRKRKDSRISITADRDADGDSIMTIEQPTPSRRFLLHCADGYTETTLLAVAYYMYANCVPLHTAYIDLHKQYKRNFFAYPSDIALLSAIQPRLLTSSPAAKGFSLTDLSPPTPEWMRKVDGSIPSRITDYMYLGNLAHANNPGLLKAMGIGQVLSVGETLDWSDEAKSAFCKDKPFACTDDSDGKWLFVGGVQDNGVDPLTEEFARCLEFIRKGRAAGTATLVHCRVGVSRSATICIAEVMNERGLSFPKAYCFVRARRLNVIIQPHLRFSYELLKYEEHQARRRGRPIKRELEWATIAREIAEMNRPYSR